MFGVMLLYSSYFTQLSIMQEKQLHLGDWKGTKKKILFASLNLYEHTFFPLAMVTATSRMCNCI